MALSTRDIRDRIASRPLVALLLGLLVLVTAAHTHNVWQQAQVEAATAGFRSGYKAAKPGADSEEVWFYTRWYHTAVHPDSTTGYTNGQEIVYEYPPGLK